MVLTLVAENLTVRFGALMALRGFSAAARAGAVTAVLGPNAAGKSTLLRTCIGAITPSTGSIWINGAPAHSLKPRRLARLAAYVPQRPVVSAAFTAREVVRLGRHAMPPDERRVEAAIDRLELGSLADRPFHELSAGQQQRVTLARALGQLEPEGHLILDEPTSAMDLMHLGLVTGILHDLARRGATVLFATHDLTSAAHVADDVWLVSDGSLAAGGAAREVLEISRLQRVFGTPFAWATATGGEQYLVARPGPRRDGIDAAR